MLQQARSIAVTFIVAGMIFLVPGEDCQAGRGGGAGGSYHGGGSYRGGSYGGYRGTYGGYRGYYGYRGYRGYYGAYLGYPYYPFYPYDPFVYVPAFAVGYPAFYAPLPPAAIETLPPPDPVIHAETTAHVVVTVPADAELWFNGAKMKAGGPNRSFETPPLAPNARFTYEAKARWLEDGRPVTQTQRFSVVPGASVNVSFPAATK